MTVLGFTEIHNILLTHIKTYILFYSIAIAAVIGKLKESSKRNILSAWIMYFVGTLFHELAHFIVSLVLGGRPTWISIFPSSQVDEQTGKKTYTLGYVTSSNQNWKNTFFISMAPLSLLWVSFFVYKIFFQYIEINLFLLLLYVFVIVSLLFSAIPSGKDFSNVFNKEVQKNFIPPIVLLIIFYLVYTKNIMIYLNPIISKFGDML